MIEVNGLKKSFDGFLALSGVDMHVKKGAIYGLVGPNGAGKSTLIRHLTGIYRPDEGEVLSAADRYLKTDRSRHRWHIYQMTCFILCRRTPWR